MNETVMIPESSKILLKFLEDLNERVDDWGYKLEILFYFFITINFILFYYVFS